MQIPMHAVFVRGKLPSQLVFIGVYTDEMQAIEMAHTACEKVEWPDAMWTIVPLEVNEPLVHTCTWNIGSPPPTSPSSKVLPACSAIVTESVAVNVCIAGRNDPVKVN